MVGQVLSHYRILERIGAGGMGVVYRGHDEQLDRDVALKVLPAGMLSDENARRRFRREAMALAKLNHPNVGAVHEFGQQNGVDFLVMELVSGVGLDAKLSEGPLPEKDVLRLGSQLADGLDAAHQQGIVHRDLKPGNLRLTADGRLKILDFGLAQWSHPEDASVVTATLTKSAEVSGTVPYMAPEQLRGQKADVRSDVYSAGAVLYEMATGKRPFPDVSGPQLIGAILEQAPSPPTSRNHRVSPALESIVIKALDKDPDRRYQSARELRVDLERLSSGVALVQRPPKRAWASTTAVAAVILTIAVAAVAVFNLGGWRERILRRPPPAPPAAAVNARRSVAVLGFKNLSGKPDQAWISTALSEMLTTELAAGEQLRTVPGENVARMKSDLSLDDADSFAPDTLSRIRKHLGSDLVVLGSYLALGKEGGDKIRLDFRLQDAVKGETIASVSETGTASELLDLVSRTGEELRQKLGVGVVAAADAPDIRASLPSDPVAARLYSEGLERLRVLEAQQARDLLEQAVAAAPKHAPSHSALAAAWSALGYEVKARDQAKQAFDLSANLSREDRLSIEGRYRELSHDWPKAMEIYRTLWGFFPDNLEYGLRLAGVQIRAGQGKDALATVEELHRLPPPAGNDPRVDLVESRAAGTLGDFKRVQQAAASAVVKGREQGARLVEAQARSQEGWALERLGKSDEALAAQAEAQRMFMAAGDRMGAAYTRHLSGTALYDKGDYAGASQAYEEALVVFRQMGNQQRAAASLNNLGNVYYDQGNLVKAKEYYQKTIDVDREIGDKPGLAGGLGNLANALDAMGDLAESLKMQQAGLAAFREVGDQRGAASTCNNLGNLLIEMGDLDGAQKKYEEALQIHSQIQHKRGAAYALFGLANVLTSRGNLSEARKRAEESAKLRGEIGEDINEAGSQAQIANITREEGHYTAAETLARSAAGEFDKNKVTEDGASAHALLATILLLENRVAEAQASAERGLQLSQQGGNRPVRFDATLAHSRTMAAAGKPEDAVRALRLLLSEARRLGYKSYEFEARLAIGEIEIKSGKSAAAARAELEALEKDARAKGFVLIADKARRARG